MKEGEHEWAATTWSPLYINLGQVYRIAKQYDQAIKCFKHAQFLACDNATVYTGLGKLGIIICRNVGFFIRDILEVGTES